MVVALADRLLLLDLVTVALMLLALVLLSTSLAVSVVCASGVVVDALWTVGCCTCGLGGASHVC